MKRFIALFILVSAFSCNEKVVSEQQSDYDKQLSILKKENDSLKLELNKYEDLIIKNTNFFLTHNRNKFWQVISINGRTIKNPKVIWEFQINNNYNKYVLKNNSLTEYETGDKVYSNTFEILTNHKILLNGYENLISKISDDTLKIGNRNRQYILIPFELK
ncbi:hypothetical protein FBALC1_05343 [Flavobacteriales bacterium ALC-1]|nr:hypothetical protein FBALC1_05343 [Flavobacteriales bacterium ALC-1]